MRILFHVLWFPLIFCGALTIAVCFGGYFPAPDGINWHNWYHVLEVGASSLSIGIAFLIIWWNMR
jgi:hypothetical protein